MEWASDLPYDSIWPGKQAESLLIHCTYLTKSPEQSANTRTSVNSRRFAPALTQKHVNKTNNNFPSNIDRALSYDLSANTWYQSTPCLAKRLETDVHCETVTRPRGAGVRVEWGWWHRRHEKWGWWPVRRVGWGWWHKRPVEWGWSHGRLVPWGWWHTYIGYLYIHTLS